MITVEIARLVLLGAGVLSFYTAWAILGALLWMLFGWPRAGR